MATAIKRKNDIILTKKDTSWADAYVHDVGTVSTPVVKKVYLGQGKFKKKRMQPSRVSWDTLFYDDIANNDGFVITEPAMVSLDGKITKTMYGPNSPLFGTTYEDENAFMERHRCKCGTFKGKQFEGEICPLCGQKVEAREIDIKKTAWISLGSNMIINPYWYQVFLNLIGTKVFPDIIKKVERVDLDGHRHDLIDGEDYEPSSPFAAIGIDGFYERYDEIMDWVAKKKKNKTKDVEICKKEKYKVFTRHIPIYSTMLRPSSSTTDTFYFNTIDKHINPLFNLSESLKDCEDIEREELIQSIQYHVNKIWAYNFNFINKKEGFIRNKLIAGSLNWTSRCVICPDPTLHVNQVELPYQAFRVLFKYRIIYYLMKIQDIPLSKAYYQWKKAYKFDKYVYDIMVYLIEKEKPSILLNRNPTLNLYSMLLLKVRSITPDAQNLTLKVPLSILSGLNADFDGDVLNIIAIMGPELERMLKNFNPIEKYIISRTNGVLDNKFAIAKGQLIDLYYFMTFKDKPSVDNFEDPDVLLPVVEQLKEYGNQRRAERALWEFNLSQKNFPKVSLNKKVTWWGDD